MIGEHLDAESETPIEVSVVDEETKALSLIDLGDQAIISPEMEDLIRSAVEYIEASLSDNTRRSYENGWKIFEAWRREKGLCYDVAPSEGQVGLFIIHLVRLKMSMATINSRLAAVVSKCRDMGWPLDLKKKAIGGVLKGVKNKHGVPQKSKEAILTDELQKMLATLGHDACGLRDRAILLVGFAGALRRSEIVGLDVGRDQTEDGSGWIEIQEQGLMLFIKGKTGWREVAVGPGSSEATCPVAAVAKWMRFGRIADGPLFRRIRSGGVVTADRLGDRQVARLVVACAAVAGLRPELTEDRRKSAFGGHSLRAGLATSADADEGAVQKQLGHASGEMTRRYKRNRDRFKDNLTKASGL